MWLPIVSLVITFLSYLKVLQGFFIQDEWLSFAYNYTLFFNKTAIAASFAPSAGHYQPLNTIFIFVLFLVFRVNYLPYAIVSLVLHLVVVFLVFVLAKRIFKSQIFAFITSTLFGTLATTYQATAWIMADLGTHFSTIFALISLILFYDFLTGKKNKYFKLSLVFLVISLFFKENAIGLFGFYPIVYFFFNKNKLKDKLKYPIIILSIGIFYLLVRVVMVFLPSAYKNGTVALKSQSVFVIIYNVLSFPVKALVQVIVPSTYLIDLSNRITLWLSERFSWNLDPVKFTQFSEHRVLEILSFIIFFLVIVVCYKLRDKKKFLVAFLFIILNGFIFGLAPERIGIISDLDSRDLYFVSIGVVFLLILFLRKLFRENTKLVLIVCSLFMVVNLILLNNKLSMLLKDAVIRKNILNQIMRENPILPTKIVFYTESDEAFYGLPSAEKIMPFQSGFGQTLLVSYFESQKFPIGMFDNRFLWDIEEQDYKQIGDRGFGYFRDFNLLKDAIKNNNLSSSNVVAYKYISGDNRLINISDEIKLKLK